MIGPSITSLTEILPFVRYADDGTILSSGSMAKGHIEAERAETGRILQTSGRPDTHYIDLSGEEPRRRTKSSCPATLDGHTLRNLPIPCNVEVSVPLYDAPRVYRIASPADLTLSFEHPGSYRVRVISAPHTPGEFTVEMPGA
ncbi:hypothetical protein [Methylobacterium sp. ID0610]|uniref:hypothetical protein n=1 Tax=Methylobacterium carpenticola TaxID=3344827 RepID=UPI0036CCDCCA